MKLRLDENLPLSCENWLPCSREPNSSKYFFSKMGKALPQRMPLIARSVLSDALKNQHQQLLAERFEMPGLKTTKHHENE
jgi:hypothetical protein